MSDVIPQTAPKAAPPKKPVAPEPKALPLPELPAIDWQKPVPVAIVRFDRPQTYPGKQADDYAKTTPQKERDARPEGDTWDVEYLAPVRMFRITYTCRGRGVRKVGFVDAARSCGWEPVA